MTSLGEELTKEDYQQITKDYDHDGSGHINYEEFIKMMS
jgi:calmodulin